MPHFSLATNVSVGHGTDKPFENFGAPWINPKQLAGYLNSRNIAGVRFVAAIIFCSRAGIIGTALPSGINLVACQFCAFARTLCLEGEIKETHGKRNSEVV